MSDALVILSRYPRLGRVKTRLAPLLTPRQCLRLHRALLLDTVDRVVLLGRGCDLFLGDCSRRELDSFAGETRMAGGVRLHLQEGEDLGQRMWNAYRKAGRGVERVVLLGSDTPSLPLEYIEQALVRLEEAPVVVGPVEDGGYYLLALSRSRAALFEGVDWGTPSVLEQTLEKAGRNGYELLPPWYDVDTPSDLRRLEGDMRHSFPGFPGRTSRFLESLGEAWLREQGPGQPGPGGGAGS